MERLDLARNGMTRLPPGFRFHPTDEELVLQYLRRKALSCPLPAAVILEINLGKYDPWDLPGGGEGERYFFNLLETKYPNGCRRNRAARSGYWKATGKDKPVVAHRYNNRVVGLKKVLVFYRGKPPQGSRTDWVMHEYRLAAAAATPPETGALRKNPTHSSLLHTKDWVVCRIFKKSAGSLDSEVTSSYHNSQFRSNPSAFINLMMQRDGVAAPSSPSASSSCVTDLSEDGEDSSSSSMASSSYGRKA